MPVVERPIRTRAATPEYEVGHVLTFRRCPSCNKKLIVDSELTDKDSGDLVTLQMHCPDEECGEQIFFDYSDPANDAPQVVATFDESKVLHPDGFGGEDFPDSGKGI